MINENPDIENYANNLFNSYVVGFLPYGKFTDPRFSIEYLREKILNQLKKTFADYLSENENFLSAKIFEDLGVIGLRHVTKPESFVNMVIGDIRGMRLGPLPIESVQPGIYATLGFGNYPRWNSNGVIIDIDLEYINHIKRKFIINPGHDWGKEGNWSYKLDQGEEALKRYIRNLMKYEKHDNEIVFRDDNLDLIFFKQVYAKKSDRDWILKELVKKGIRTINDKDIADFIALVN